MKLPKATEAEPDPEYKINSLEELRVIAETHDCELYVGKPDLLLLDLDTPEQVTQYAVVRTVLGSRFGLCQLDSWKSRNGRDHVVVQVAYPLTVPERLALGCALGSDPKRAALALWEWRESKTDTISLFKPKEKP